MKIIIRPETDADYELITNVINLAFKQTNEGILVEKLRETSCFVSQLSLVALVKGKIVGHVLFYPITINTEKAFCSSLSLAPIAVHPDYQRRGIGSKLVEEGMEAAKRLGYSSVIVIGHSTYYPRFGFKTAKEYGISAPFDVPENAFFAKALVNKGLENCSGGKVVYPKEFYDCM